MTRLRWFTAGESHGPKVVAIVEGMVAGLPLLASDVDEDLARRQRGYGRGARMKIETDRVTFVGGVRDGRTLGSPIAIEIPNRDHESWAERMSPGPLPSPAEPLMRPRPGHADLAGGLKYDRRDLRDVLERASARETAARTAARRRREAPPARALHRRLRPRRPHRARRSERGRHEPRSAARARAQLRSLVRRSRRGGPHARRHPRRGARRRHAGRRLRGPRHRRPPGPRQPRACGTASSTAGSRRRS